LFYLFAAWYNLNRSTGARTFSIARGKKKINKKMEYRTEAI